MSSELIPFPQEVMEKSEQSSNEASGESVISFGYEGKEYQFDVENISKEQCEAVSYVKDLYEGRKDLSELDNDTLDEYIISLMRYSNETSFEDDEIRDRSLNIMNDYQQGNTPVIGSTTYRDSEGNVFDVDILTEESKAREVYEKAKDELHSTQSYVLNNVVANLIDKKINSKHEFLNREPIKDGTIPMYLAYGRLFRNIALGKEPQEEKYLPEWQRETYKFNMDVLPNSDVVVGEKHTRIVRNENYENLLRGRLESLGPDALIVTETDDVYEYMPPGKYQTFMFLAKNYAKKNNLEILSLDDESTRAFELNPNVIELWKSMGFTEEDAIFQRFCMITHFRLREMIQNDSYSEESLDTLIDEVTHMEGFIEHPKYVNDVVSWYKRNIHKEGCYWDIEKFLYQSIVIENQIREDLWRKKLGLVKKRNPDRQVFIVVGDAHRKMLTEFMHNPDDNYIHDTKYEEVVEEYRRISSELVSKTY